MDFKDIGVRYKQIAGFEDYFVTEYGDVYSIRLRGKEQEPHLHKLKPKNPGSKNKYLNVILCNDKGHFTKSIHRLVAENFVSGYFEGAVVNHIDGNNRNNAASNLEWTTVKDNVHKSYITSGKLSNRNHKEWKLYSPTNNLVGVFNSHLEMKNYIKEYRLDTSPSQLTKKGTSRGYFVKKTKVYN